MGFEILPFEVQVSIFKQLLPSELVKLWHDVPEMKQFITPGILRIVTTSVNEMKLKYDFPNEFYFQYECNSDSEEHKNLAHLEFQHNFKGFYGSILIEFFRERSSTAHGLNVELFKPYIFEIIWNCEDHLYHDGVATFEDIIEKAGNNLKLITVKYTGYDDFIIDKLPDSILTQEILQYSDIGKVAIQNFNGHILSEMFTLIPDLERLNMESASYGDNILGDDLNINDFIFPEIDVHPLASFNRLKEIEIGNYLNNRYELSNLYFPNLQKFTLKHCSIHSIENLKAPKLKIFEIQWSAIFIISCLELHSLDVLSIHLIARKQSTTGDSHSYEFIMEYIKSKSLKDFNLTGSAIIGIVQNLYFPALESASIISSSKYEGYFGTDNVEPFINCDNLEYLRLSGCTNILKLPREYQSVKTLYLSGTYYNDDKSSEAFTPVRTSFPNLENLKMKNLELDEHDITEQILTQPSKLNKLELKNCPGFKIDQILHHENLKSLLIQNYSFEPFQNITIPSLIEFEIHFTESEFIMENCTFEKLEYLAINLGSKFSDPGTIKFVENLLPKLEILKLEDHKVTNHISTKSYPLLEQLAIDHIDSLEIVPSDSLNTLDLSKNHLKMDLDFNEDDFPNLEYYDEPQG
ncbi:Internalin-I [Wickerhamomyces ciferrii]|uniref:Internalin-I n=1 Tax=Wickerhamomyces ciferrii (strain ATCC 14091 / BCRC 22168 / CBS 111 / JCM 3599 / NBRC 0793 / NRRL Y-1031 F-60-10) TaxID=1206466 RepID=K0KG46_WICCF|nr:Internalin-I [Wickerhamomyces ciferrii]CCH41172.1 Internalin-I [Wickerhamomyces ciferrii]